MRAVRPPGAVGLRVLPASRAGQWALLLFDVAVVAFGFMVVVTAGRHQGEEVFSEHWWLAVPAVIGGLGTLGAAALGGYAILRRRERGLVTFAATGIALTAVVYFFGEVLRNR
jgi:cell division protein FtsW (lipid II flippase)